ncbi:unnamed protein product [Ectocarpus sp. CCAP 1310/34]|jgi:hypothetical protein|nr:unnamed protein product [Ectocarpus sp. CCAP 1310/34]
MADCCMKGLRQDGLSSEDLIVPAKFISPACRRRWWFLVRVVVSILSLGYYLPGLHEINPSKSGS